MRTRQQTGSRKEATNSISATGSRKSVLNKKGEANSSRSVNSEDIVIADSSDHGESFSTEDLSARIALRAHKLYEQRGGCHGEDQADWFEAERQILASG